MSEKPATSKPNETCIKLQVGERQFMTSRQTLTGGGSGYFAGLFSGRWNTTIIDGYHFIDADADLFPYILRYLRRGVPPLFYDKGKGYDHGLYLALLQEAKYFDVQPLVDWIEHKRYLRVLQTTSNARQVDDLAHLRLVHDPDTEVEYVPMLDKVMVYICPRQIPVHKGNPDACGRLCKLAQGGADPDYEEESEVKWVLIERATVYNMPKVLDKLSAEED